MAAGATSYYDLPYDELYEAGRVRIALTHGVRYPADELDHPDELGAFEGRLVGFCKGADYAEAGLDLQVPVQLVLYRRWSDGLPEFDRAPSSELGTAALGIGRYDQGHYNCRVVVRDEEDSLTQSLLTALLAAAMTGKQEIEVTLSGRRDLTAYADEKAVGWAAKPPREEDHSFGLVGSYAWSELGVEPGDFGEALDACEHEPPLAHFEEMHFQVEVDLRRIVKLLGMKAPEPRGQRRSM